MRWASVLVYAAVSSIVSAYRPDVNDENSMDAPAAPVPSELDRQFPEDSPKQDRDEEEEAEEEEEDGKEGIATVQVLRSAQMKWEGRKHPRRWRDQARPREFSLHHRGWSPSDRSMIMDSRARVASETREKALSKPRKRRITSLHQRHSGLIQGNRSRLRRQPSSDLSPSDPLRLNPSGAAADDLADQRQLQARMAQVAAGSGLHDPTAAPGEEGRNTSDSSKRPGFDLKDAGGFIIEGLRKHDLGVVRSVLRVLDAALETDAQAFDPNVPAPAWPRLPGSNNTETLPVLAFAARTGWLPGLEEFVEWDRGRTDSGTRLQLDQSAGARRPTPLLLAIEAGHSAAAAYLLQKGASVAVQDEQGRTPLEVAARGGSWELVSALLGPGSLLEGGLLGLWLRLLHEAEDLPRLEGRWSQGNQENRLRKVQEVVPQAIWPLPDEREVVGGDPTVWLLLYKNKVMCALADGAVARGLPVESTSRLLVSHSYHSFVRDFSLSCLLLSGMLLFFGVLTYLAFRIRLFGWCETPVSMAEFISGGFDPVRLADPDFDPSRQKARLPYLTAKEYLGPQVSSWEVVITAFAQAILGVFSAWLLQFVRIPPEKDPYDEDYLSDEDEACRARVRELCMARASRVRCLEIYVRNLAATLLTIWLVLWANRWGEAAMLALLYFYHAWLASSVAGCTVPLSQEPEKTPDDREPRSEEPLDSARVVHALFSVQHGPRWARAICSTRSTAAPTSSTKQRWLRRRNRRQHQQAATAGPDTDKSGSEAGTRDTGREDKAPPQLLEADETAFSDWFQRSFLQSGLLHVSHGALLFCSLLSMALVSMALLWLAHGRRLMSGDWLYRYAWVSPKQLFEVYGAPGSGQRGCAMLLELLLLWLAGERIYNIVSLLNVAALSLEQRRGALQFARKHQPTICKKNADEALGMRAVLVAVEESVRCFEFALELSSVRWAVLREPTLIMYLCTVKFLLAALLLLVAPFAGPDGAFWLREGAFWMGDWSMLDPMVPLFLSLCLAFPLLGILFTAAASNRDITQQQDQLRYAADTAVSLAASAGKEVDDVQYVQLRVKTSEALQHCFISWPGGRLLGMTEPVLLLCLLAGTTGFAVSEGLGIRSPG